MYDLAKPDRFEEHHIDPVVVLHIEDDLSVARAVARLLRLQGYEVVGADRVFAKPADVGEVLNEIARLLGTLTE